MFQVLDDRLLGCADCPFPPAEDHICRRGPDEEVLILAERRLGHTCQFSHTVISIVVWDGVSKELADEVYVTSKFHLQRSDVYRKRNCTQNKKKNCYCQGSSTDKMGVSYSFGCSWSTQTQGIITKFIENDGNGLRTMIEVV